ncbi:MAG TPA: stage IV sporulation protein A [Firmicutes bacterium]|nr:stage IV sporulation protein A [Bacillota bacterium]HAA34323.1 stage IV sporulation protein A [Bacillota bacterium]
MKFDLFKDIIERTGGDIYLGVVGPVRTGKSTFIKKFMEILVLPNIDNPHVLERTKDELPQGSAGKTIMTTEPKFVPDEAIEIKLEENISMRVRLVDCVGYTVPGAVGYDDEGKRRMVSTPWFDEPVPFEQAAETGTRKVIQDHSTIGVVITTDGTITDIPRESYIEAERRVISELKEIGKPFVVVLNSTMPFSESTLQLEQELSQKYEVPVVSLNCLELEESNINLLFKEILYEFPVQEININLPSWVEALEPSHELSIEYTDIVREHLLNVERLRDIETAVEAIRKYDIVEEALIRNIEPGRGYALFEITAPQELYDKILSQICEVEIEDQADLLKVLKEFAYARKEFNKIAQALQDVKEKGYGIVPPFLEEISLEEPEIIRQGSRFGVRLQASAPSLHFVRVDIKSEFTPIVGTEKQSEELVNYLLEEFAENPEKLWESNLFGKSLYELVKDGISGKLSNMPANAQQKLRETLERILNEGSGGLIVIIL